MGALGLGILPGSAPGLALAAGLNVGAVQVSARGSQYLDRPAERKGTRGWLTVDLATVDLRIGWRMQPRERWELVPAASLEFGRFSGEGHSVEARETPRFAWGAAGLGAALEVRLGTSWLVVGEADALVPFQRTQFTLNHTTLHRPAPVGGVARLGIAFEVGKRP
jgi:hypothetical protein